GVQQQDRTRSAEEPTHRDRALAPQTLRQGLRGEKLGPLGFGTAGSVAVTRKSRLEAMPRTRASGQQEPVHLRQTAEQLATSRRERVTSAHLLVAMVEQGGPAADLLRERRLTRDVLLQAARSSSDDEADPLRVAVQRARDVARRLRSPQPTPL